MAYPKKKQDFDKFTLLDLLGEDIAAVTWLAFDRDLKERVCLKLYKSPVTEEDLSATNAYIKKSKGLIHQNILRTFEAGFTESIPYLSQQFLRNASPIALGNGSFSENWSTISLIIDALAFTHSLGLIHGRLNPNKIMLDETGHLWISGFGVRLGKVNSVYLAPKAEETSSRTDDIYSLGALIYRFVAGEELSEVTPDLNLIPRELRSVIKGMLEISDYERLDDLIEIKQSFSSYAEGVADHSSISPDTSFAKRRDPPIKCTSKIASNDRSVNNQIPVNAAVIGLLILVSLASFVFFYLPKDRAVPMEQPVGKIEEIIQGESLLGKGGETNLYAPFELAQIELAKKQSLELTNQILRLQIKLEDLKVELWAKDSYDLLTKNTILGDEFFRRGQYLEALTTYKETQKNLEDLYGSASKTLIENTKIGNMALENGKANLAIRTFRIATAIDQEDDFLKTQLKRSENLNSVLSLINLAKSAEQQNQLNSALQLYEEAKNKDSLWKPATEGILRVGRLIKQGEFEIIMSRAFTELAQKNYEEARTAFEIAKTIFPRSSEPEDGMLQVELTEMMDEIDILRLEAEQHVRDELWGEAIKKFELVLQLDDSLVFAINGVAEANKRLELSNRLQLFIDDPTLMKDDKKLRDAKRAIAAASIYASRSHITFKQTDTLSKLISVARIPIQIFISSDGKTDIFVYQASRLGKIKYQELELYPGTYTIVGKRRGYRDTQYTLKLLANMPVEPINIICNEKI
ncbi:MAG: hypothetical protein CMP95_05630 [Gammaproteobacteria bacterium]|uniref:non-specific serine/threonine protein kinase n=1 Tax=OM182 bacterium TaxID=2510334 RepID=A0A520S488_9GAMM|nr:hypothetical protein [Gammaproteobacteria bacterium]OUV68213.1 MAG: hypothetical protein CBC93_02480 [Gammaproteobacteria bacterium TMED133]RZO77297.1 MAG: hypothetical protein EVA68_01535 [OM182 bacterium]